MKTTVYFEICTGQDSSGELISEELGFEATVEVFYEKPDHSVGIGESFEIVYGNMWTLESSTALPGECSDPKRVLSDDEMEALVGLGGVSWDASLRAHEESVVDDWREAQQPDYEDEDDQEWDDPSMGGRDPLDSFEG